MKVVGHHWIMLSHSICYIGYLHFFENKMYLSKKFKTQMLTLNTYIVASTFESAYAMNIGFESKTCWTRQMHWVCCNMVMGIQDIFFIIVIWPFISSKCALEWTLNFMMYIDLKRNNLSFIKSFTHGIHGHVFLLN